MATATSTAITRKRRSAGRKRANERRRAKWGADAPVNVAELRQQLGAVYGKRMVSRQVLAKLVGASQGSILNWERGGVPSRAYLPVLRRLAQQVAEGTFRPKHRDVGDASDARHGRNEPLPTAGLATTVCLYANGVNVRRGRKDARLQFVLQLAGEREPRAVCDVAVPLALLADLRGEK